MAKLCIQIHPHTQMRCCCSQGSMENGAFASVLLACYSMISIHLQPWDDVDHGPGWRTRTHRKTSFGELWPSWGTRKETRHGNTAQRGSMRQQNPVSGHIRTSKDHGQCNSCQALLGNALVSEVWKRRKAHYEPPCCNTDIIDILGCRMPWCYHLLHFVSMNWFVPCRSTCCMPSCLRHTSKSHTEALQHCLKRSTKHSHVYRLSSKSW